MGVESTRTNSPEVVKNKCLSSKKKVKFDDVIITKRISNPSSLESVHKKLVNNKDLENSNEKSSQSTDYNRHKRNTEIRFDDITKRKNKDACETNSKKPFSLVEQKYVPMNDSTLQSSIGNENGDSIAKIKAISGKSSH